MKLKGTACDIDVHLAQPGPLNVPKTFWAPWPMKITPSDKRNGKVTQVEEVDVSLRSITATFQLKFVWIVTNYKSVCALTPSGSTHSTRDCISGWMAGCLAELLPISPTHNS